MIKRYCLSYNSGT